MNSTKAKTFKILEKVNFKRITNSEGAFLDLNDYHSSELFFGLSYAVGTEYQSVVKHLKKHLKLFGYDTEEIRISKDIILPLIDKQIDDSCEYNRINTYMDYGNHLRREMGLNSILALGVATHILNRRQIEENDPKPRNKVAYIINSLKHPDEVKRLRETYSNCFFLIGIYADKDTRKKYLEMEMTPDEATKLIDRDEHESYEYGQDTRGTFQMSDFFVGLNEDTDNVKANIIRIIDLLFGCPYITPTFDEYAMFMAFTSSLRSADLSRQVGAVIAVKDEIIASGANDCPKFGGGLYWPMYDGVSKNYIDYEKGRDYTRQSDSNKNEQYDMARNIIDCLGLNRDLMNILINNSFIKDIHDQEERDKFAMSVINCLDLNQDFVQKLVKGSRIKDITEYGRIVHAEMETLLMCSRNTISCEGGTLYCTTFPCHNCAKHIIAAGIHKVYYIEPYPKSKAFQFHDDSISSKISVGKVAFLPFIGVGPRKFFDLFSISLSSGYNVIRKGDDGKAVNWERGNAHSRFQLRPASYLDHEIIAYQQLISKFKEKDDKNENRNQE